MLFRTLIAIALALVLLPLQPNLAEAEGGAIHERMHHGIRLMAFPAPGRQDFDVSIMGPRGALDRITQALDLIRRKSAASARRLDALKKHGVVILIYFPNNFRNRARLNNQNVALFLPNFLKKRGQHIGKGKEFIVVINHFGVKWPVRELAAVVVHELVGHGGQHLRGRIASGRVLDLECEASLHQEKAYQDFGVPKKSRSVVLFRRQMEMRFCSDFRAFMRRQMPEKLALWDVLNPRVDVLLRHFETYRRQQTSSTVQPAGSVTHQNR